MKLFGRRERAPEVVLEAAGLDRRDKVLSFAQEVLSASGQRWLLGTTAALHVVTPGEEPVTLRWETVQAADWNQDESTLTVTEIGEYGQQRASYVFNLENPILLLQLIRERVTASVVLQRGYLVEGKKGFKVIGRRSPNGGEITWMHEYDAGIDPERSDVQEAATQALVRARADVGE